ncbi:MAG: hypothetical protein IT379_36450 [Deltaproteobacteria bacterium]|nr:hypothetical protein [Deltaproteobacteria bacterium]
MRWAERLGTLAVVAALVGCGSGSDSEDAGTPAEDAFVPRPDTSVPEEDAFVPEEDAFVPEEDAFVPEEDAFVPEEDASRPDAGPAPLLETAASDENTGPTGEIAVTVPVTDHRSFMVVATGDTNARLAALDITAPDGTTLVRWQDWTDAQSLTWAFYAERTSMAINWPVRDVDPALVPGDYVVRLGSYRVDGVTSRPDVPIRVTTITNRDHDLDVGHVRVAILWANGLGDDAALVSATERAVAHWADVWSSAAGMEIEVRYLETTLDTTLPYPSPMSGDLLLEASSLTEPGEVPVIIGDSIDGSTSQYGVAGRIPGPMVASTISAIVVGWLANAGGDGEFSDADITLYGEVLAHEVGHYIGLFHPFEQTYDSWDALDDTPECTTRRMCIDMLSTNLMFPFSICEGGTCVSTTELTSDQRGVMQRYTGAL